MANNGVITQQTTRAYLRLYWNLKSSSPSENKSTIEFTFTFQPIIGQTANKPITAQATVNGESHAFTLAQGYHASSEKTLGTFTQTFTHNPDGSKSVSVSFWINGAPFADWDKITYDGTLTLPTINRRAMIIDAPDFTDLDNPKISYENPAGAAVTSLSVCISKDGSLPDVPYRDVPIVMIGAYTFKLTAEEKAILYRMVEQGASRTVKFYIRTVIDGNTFFHHLTKTFTITDPEPILTTGIWDTNVTTRALTGFKSGNEKFIKYHSNAQCTISAQAQKEATISSFSVKNGSLVISNREVANFIEVKDATFTYSTTDSRGFVVTEVKEYELIPYIPLTASLKIDTFTPTGEMKVTITGKYYQGSFGASNNFMNVTLELKSTDGSTLVKKYSLGNVYPTVDSLGNYTYSYTMTGVDYTQNYMVVAQVTDALTPDLSSSTIAAPIPVFDWSKNDFNFNVPVSFNGETMVDWIVETGQEAMGSNGIWYWTKWHSGKAECYGCRNYGNMAVTTAWGSLYTSYMYTQSLPTGLFKAVPEVMSIDAIKGSYGCWVIMYSNSEPTATASTGFTIASAASKTINQLYLGFHCIGRWK